MSVFTDALNLGQQAHNGVISYYFSNSYATWNTYEKIQFEAAMQVWKDVANITFIQAPNEGMADFVYNNVSNAQMNTILGEPAGTTGILGAFQLPNAAGSQQTSVFNYEGTGWDFANSNGGLEQGGYGFLTMVHELGHGLGLDHPHEGTPLPGVTVNDDSDLGDHNYNQGINTVMSYNDGIVANGLNGSTTPGNGWTGTPMTFDIAAIQELYGANTAHETGDNVYTLPNANAIGTFYSAIWDTGGTDSIVAQDGADAIINLNAASLVANDPDAGGVVSASDGIYGGFTIANGVVIENATGANGNDTITGNAANNVLDGGTGSDYLDGGAGDDTMVLAASNAGDVDVFSGGAGEDTVDFSDFNAGIWVDLEATDSEAWTRDSADLTTGTWRKFGELDGIENIVGTVNADDIYGNAEDNIVTFLGTGVNGNADHLYGRDGNDTVDFSQYQEGVWVDLEFGGIEAWAIQGASYTAIATLDSFENIEGTDGADWMYGGAGDNVLTYNGSGLNGDADQMFGRGGEDTVTFENSSSAVLVDLADGGIGAWTRGGEDLESGTWAKIAVFHELEHVAGSDFNDEITGTSGDNNIDGGLGDDTLTGGAGSDTFWFGDASGADVITDWEDGLDLLSFSNNLSVNAFADVTVDYSSGDAVITTADADTTVTLEGITGGITADDFVF